MTAATRDEVVVQLGKVLDPCSIAMRAPIDIWEMGLVEAIEIVDRRIRVSLVLTDISCVHFRDIRRHIADALLELPGVDEVEVELDTSTLWTPERMKETC
jgi:metal-sulfur cluster biosynthetic enzyme